MRVRLQVQDLCQRLVVVSGQDGLSVEAQRNATIMSMSLLRANLASKRLLKVSSRGRQDTRGQRHRWGMSESGQDRVHGLLPAGSLAHLIMCIVSVCRQLQRISGVPI